MAQLEHFPTKKHTSIDLGAAEMDLQKALEQIQIRRGGDQLMRLLQDLVEAGQLEPVQEETGDRRIRCCKVTEENEFASRFFAIDDEIQSSIASCSCEDF
jgi:hypothetical protein